MKILVDTNVLARIAQPAHRQHTSASTAVEKLLDRNDDPCIVPQVIYEFWAVATRPASVNGLGMTVRQAQAELTRTGRIFTLLRDERAIFEHGKRLVSDHEVEGKNAHDARLAAAMIRHSLSYILTFNAADFARFPGIIVLTPESVLAP